MVKILIEDKIFYYYIRLDSNWRYITEFYDSDKTNWFGRPKGNFCFDVDFNIEDPSYKKGYVKFQILNEFYNWQDYNKRNEEIKRGEII